MQNRRIVSFPMQRSTAALRRATRTVAFARTELLESRTLLSSTHGDPQLGHYLLKQHGLFSEGDYLSQPAQGDALTIAMQYLRNNAAQLGLSQRDVAHVKVTDRYTDADTGVTHLYLRQTYRGLEVANANLNINVMADGRILNIGGGFVPGLGRLTDSNPSAPQPKLGVGDALRKMAPALGLQADAAVSLMASALPPGIEMTSTLVAPGLSLDAVPAKLKYVATPKGVQLTWDYVLRTPDGKHWYNVNADASTGQLALASDWVDYATYNVFPLPVENPLDGSRSLVSNPHLALASPYGWHDANGSSGAEYTDTRGNNVYAQEDRNGDNAGGFRPDGGAGLNFDYPMDLTQAPSTYESAAITNLFYWNNLSHDLHYVYGFTEAAGNFQFNTYGRGGTGDDPVQADAQDGSWMNNANFATPPDGMMPRMQMFLFNLTNPNRDGDLENTIIVHEYGHGVSNRLVGGPANANALDAIQSGGMGEGWSDWWSLMFSQKPTDGKMDAYPVGNYVLGQPNNDGGIRRYPYSFDMTVNPLTYDDYNISNEVHDSGEIWASTLWDLTWLLIDKYGFSQNLAAGYTGAGSAGNILALKLVMDALKLTPANPTFLDGRDAILQADQVLTRGANRTEIWTAFARRGMGVSADDGGDPNADTVVGAFDMPSPDPVVRRHSPTGSLLPVSSITLTFSEAMNASSFSPASDIVSFTGPSGASLLGSIAGYTWDTPSQLTIRFVTQSAGGTYRMVVGPQILSADNGHAMDQDGDSLPGEAMDDRYAASFTIRTAVYTANMDSNPNWTLEGGWAYGDPTGAPSDYGNPDPSSGYTGTNVIGYNLNGPYSDNMSATEWVTTGAIDCSSVANTELSFYRWLGVEEGMNDQARIQVSNNGTSWTTVWQNTVLVDDGEWTKVTYNIGAVADGRSTVYIRWGLGPTDASWSYAGWNIDDVMVTGIGTGVDRSGPRVISHSPTGLTAAGQTSIHLTFNEPINPFSFSVADDVVSFTGPGGVDLKPQIVGATWASTTDLLLYVTPLLNGGAYAIVIGPNITDATVPGNLMNQDGDPTNGETSDDRFTATFTIGARIEGDVWRDANGNAVRDANEPGLGGRTVYLDLNGNGQPDPGALLLEPDNYAGDSVLNDAVPGVTLWTTGTAASNGKAYAVATNFTSTGDMAFGKSNGNAVSTGWLIGEAELWASFATPVSTVSIDAIADTGGERAVLMAYGAAGNVIATYMASPLPAGAVATLTVTRPTADIVRIMASGYGELAGLDNLRIGTGSPEPTAVTSYNGHYLFSPLVAGSYTVRQVLPTGYMQTWPAAGAAHLISLADGEAATGKDFGIRADKSVPTNLALSASTLPENRPTGTVVGTFTTADADPGDTFSYSLVPGAGSADNASFNIAGNQLRTNAPFDFEAQSSYSIRVRATDSYGLNIEKTFTITVLDIADEIIPTISATSINGGATQRSMVRQLNVTFSEPVTLGAGAITVRLSNGNAPANTAVNVTNPSADQMTYVITFSGAGAIGGSLPDGIYDLKVTAAAVQDLGGNALTANLSQRFHRLFGDANGDKKVNTLDYTRMRLSLGKSTGQALFNDALDADSSGLVNVTDLSQFRRRFGMKLIYA